MAKGLIRTITGIFAVVVVLVLGVSPGTGKSPEEILVICNKSAPVESLSRQDIQEIFLGKNRFWSNQDKIIFVTLDEKIPAHRMFLRAYIRKTPVQYVNYWKKMLFTGKGHYPVSFSDEDELIDYVSKTKGAIGYASQADSSLVKILPVQ